MQNRPTRYRHLRTWLALVLCCCLCQCLQTYVSPYKSPPTGYLVVEGFIATNAPTQFSLTRVIGLAGDSTIPAVGGATVRVQGSDSSLYRIPELSGGLYGGITLYLDPTLQYRLLIQTPNGESYASDFVTTKITPPIDSVNWIYDPNNGVNIYVNTHDPNNATHYYRWTCEQTWQYDMAELSLYVYDPYTNTVVPRQPNQYVYTCWKDVRSTTVMLGNTSKLSKDIVYDYPLVNIPNNSQQLEDLYSIQVTQSALTADAYNYLNQLLANTESLGSLFDIQPTLLTGNIHCLNNAAEPVIGYVSAGTIEVSRIFISRSQVPGWEYYSRCYGNDFLVKDFPDTVRYFFASGLYTPVVQTVGGWTANGSYCVDCTSLGGSNVKPSFWPN
jgi:hypothetical protein